MITRGEKVWVCNQITCGVVFTHYPIDGKCPSCRTGTTYKRYLHAPDDLPAPTLEERVIRIEKHLGI